MVLVANHQSMIDIPTLFRAVPVPLRFMLKQELARVPLVGWYARTMGMVFIERGVTRSAPRRLREAVARVRGGATLVAFPEGTRSRDGSVGPFKGGALHRTRAPAERRAVVVRVAERRRLHEVRELLLVERANAIRRALH